jgi:hypothetical protein
MRILFKRLFHNRLSRLWHWLPRRVDLLFFIAAILYSLPSLGYPFGRDQAVHFYIGREWLNGLVPYRDLFDHKPPGIHLVHAVSIVLFGAQQWSIRIMDMAALLCMGWITAGAVRRVRPRASGERGVIWLLITGFYLTCFDYWDTAQVETWEALALIAGYAVAESGLRPWLRAVVAGALSGVALIFKFPAIIVVVVIAAIVALRSRGDTGEHRMVHMLQSLGCFAAGMLIIMGACAGYFAAHGGFEDLIDMLFKFNAYYALNKPTDADVAKLWAFDFWFDNCEVWVLLFFLSWLAGVVVAAKNKQWSVLRGALVAMLLCMSAGASVWMQQKFYSYHWVVMVPFIILCAGYGIALCMRYRPLLTSLAAIGMVLFSFIDAPLWPSNSSVSYLTATSSFWEYIRGYTSRKVYVDQFIGGY